MTDSDWVKRERDHEYSMAKLARDERENIRSHRTQRVQAVAWVVGIVFVVGMIVSAIYVTNGRASGQIHEREMACITSGGMWATLNEDSTCMGRVVVNQ